MPAAQTVYSSPSSAGSGIAEDSEHDSRVVDTQEPSSPASSDSLEAETLILGQEELDDRSDDTDIEVDAEGNKSNQDSNDLDSDVSIRTEGGSLWWLCGEPRPRVTELEPEWPSSSDLDRHLLDSSD